MSDESVNNEQNTEAKPKKQPRQWPARAADTSSAASEGAPSGAPSGPASPAETPAPAAAESGEKPKKQPKVWKGTSTAATAPVAPTLQVTAAPRVAAPPVAAKTAATAKPPAIAMEVPKRPEVIESEAKLIRRRRFAINCVFGFLAANFVMFMRFFFPRVLFEPKTVFKIGYPSDFGLGVNTKFQKDYRIWVVRSPSELFVIYAKCTHLGCTPDWIASENKFKCPCHGSGYDSDGINFEGPAPRPMDRAKVELDPTGQIVVDTSKLYQWPKGGRSQFYDAGAFLPV